MRRESQSPLPGTGGRIRYGRRAAASSKAPTVTEGRLPLAFQTIIRPEQVILHVRMPGEPAPKKRPRFRAALYGTGKVLQGKIIAGSGDLRLVQNAYPDRLSVDAEEVWRLVMQARRTFSGDALTAPVGLMAYFETRGERTDVDNMLKTVMDSGTGILWADDRQITQVHAHISRRSQNPATSLLAWRLSPYR